MKENQTSPDQLFIESVISGQDNFYNTNQTKDIQFRLKALKNLKQVIRNRETRVIEALDTDLNKCPFEAFSSELALVYQEINLHIRKLKSWSRPRKVPSTLLTFPSVSHIHHQPFGRVLIISPFNYPFQLNLLPLIGAISAGNTAVLKPSEFTPNTSDIINSIISEAFNPEYVKVFTGGVEVSKLLLEKQWDKIFFTGSQRVGKMVLEAAAKHLTPVVLELGGKNPVIVDRDANLRLAAKRIAWGKSLNAGQSCVGPDYVLVHHEVKDEFLKLIGPALIDFFGSDPSQTSDYSRLVSQEAVDRQADYIKDEKIIYGGVLNREKKYFSPTVISEILPESPIMQEEIFGPVLPVLTFNNLNDALELINKKNPPLSLYYFSENKRKQREFLSNTTSGGVGINDVVIYFINPHLPFGGIGTSGMGNYHGKRSFDTFSHERGVMRTSTWIDLPIRYPPYKKAMGKILQWWFR